MNWEDIIKVGYIPSDARKRSAPTINWMDAFHKFGFDDGHEYSGQTEEIAMFLQKNGYSAQLVEAGAIVRQGGHVPSPLRVPKSESHADQMALLH